MQSQVNYEMHIKFKLTTQFINWKHIFVTCKNMCKNLELLAYNLAQQKKNVQPPETLMNPLNF